ncbi:2-dehydro-3-deoxyglucarate aldolase [hydrothermal vent metagenome]|uniref:2-dehydro-3-deoxyglucarate aldolase n=1 Tax=hydrothermal vent metagenome TaxID=652676 RepID=A0A3B0TTY8_9ZZZZ
MKTLAARLADGDTLYTGWAGWPDPLHAEALARAGFDTVTLDMQHGIHGIEGVSRCIAAVALAAKPAMVRIPLRDWGSATRALDVGASAVIAPMINSVADAKAFAEVMKYPPSGGRSWGPERAMGLGGFTDAPDYLRNANAATLAIAMIETREALAALDGILAVDGIDGIFVGPSDFSIAWSNGATVDAGLDDMMPAIADIAARTKAAGKIRMIFCTSPALGVRYRAMGYQLLAVGWDPHYVETGARTLLEAVKTAS